MAISVEGPEEWQGGTEGPVLDATIVETDIRWTLVGGGQSKLFHRPDSVALAQDEAVPSGESYTKESSLQREYRVVKRGVLQDEHEPCIPCFSRVGEVGTETVSCSECGKDLTRSLFQGPEPTSINALIAECPRCNRQQVIQLD